jgi:hypothetical protein
MANLTLNINQWLCGNKREDREGVIGLNHLGNSEGVLLKENHPLSKEHSMCCIGQFLNQAGIHEEYLLGYGQPSDFNHSNDHEDIDHSSYNQEIANIFFLIDEDEHFSDTELANELMEINDDDQTTVFQKIKAIKQKLEHYGHTLTIEDPKGELDQIREIAIEGMEID